jgi:glutaconate CoA-transferase, subunit A
MTGRDRRRSLGDALDDVGDGARVGIGGLLARRRPLAACRELVTLGRRGLHVWSFLAGTDVEILAAGRSVASVTSGYLDPQADARATMAARDDGSLAWREVSEHVFVGGLLAAANGLPFWPTLGAVGSALVDELGLREITCPYTGRSVLAVPATPLDVALLHADAATPSGAVLAPVEREFLDDADVVMARAARKVVVTVARIADDDEAAGGGRSVLAPFEIDAVVPVTA